jgi:hypothetical protein
VKPRGREERERVSQSVRTADKSCICVEFEAHVN